MGAGTSPGPTNGFRVVEALEPRLLSIVEREDGDRDPFRAAEVENTLPRALHSDFGLKDAAGKPTRTAYKRRFHDLGGMER